MNYRELLRLCAFDTGLADVVASQLNIFDQKRDYSPEFGKMVLSLTNRVIGEKEAFSFLAENAKTYDELLFTVTGCKNVLSTEVVQSLINKLSTSATSFEQMLDTLPDAIAYNSPEGDSIISRMKKIGTRDNWLLAFKIAQLIKLTHLKRVAISEIVSHIKYDPRPSHTEMISTIIEKMSSKWIITYEVKNSVLRFNIEDKASPTSTMNVEYDEDQSCLLLELVSGLISSRNYLKADLMIYTKLPVFFK